jgi:hypothetical protein
MSDVVIFECTDSITAKSGEWFDLKIKVTTFGITNLIICAEFARPTECKFFDQDGNPHDKICESRPITSDLNNKELIFSLKIECPCGEEYNEFPLHLRIIVSDGDNEEKSDTCISQVLITC